jgi:hypothetical protein
MEHVAWGHEEQESDEDVEHGAWIHEGRKSEEGKGWKEKEAWGLVPGAVKKEGMERKAWGREKEA